MKKTITLIILTLIIFISTNSTQSQIQNNTTKDVSVTILLQDYYNETKIIEEPIIVRNHDDETGLDDALLVQIYWNYTTNNTIMHEHQEIKSINSFSKKIGKLNITTTGNYSFCAKITAINYNDYNESNNEECKTIIVQIEQEEQENELNETEQEEQSETEIEEENNNSTNSTQEICKNLSIETKKTLFELGETTEYKIIMINDSNSSYSIPVNYWIQDLQGEIIRAARETTNKAEKSFTPTFNGEEKAYIIKATTNCAETEKIIVFKGKPESKEEFMEITVPEKINNKIFIVGIKGYKGNNAKTLITIYAEQNGKIISEKTKAYVKNKNTPYAIDVPVLLKGTYEGEIKIITEGLGFQKETELISEIKHETIQIAKGIIESFYTRNQLYSEIITVYAKMSNYQGKTIRIMSSTETKEINGVSDIKENISIKNAEEIIILEILDKNKSEDIKYIKLGLEVKQTPQKNETKTETTQIIEKTQKEVQNFSSPEIKTASITGMMTKSKGNKFNYTMLIIGIIAVITLLKGKLILNYVKNAKLFK